MVIYKVLPRVLRDTGIFNFLKNFKKSMLSLLNEYAFPVLGSIGGNFISSIMIFVFDKVLLTHAKQLILIYISCVKCIKVIDVSRTGESNDNGLHSESTMVFLR